MEFDTLVKQTIYRHFADTSQAPSSEFVAATLGASVAGVLAAFARLREQRLLVLEPDNRTIRMAPPFSAVPTRYSVEARSLRYDANCAWDALGIPAALHETGTVRSACPQTGARLALAVGPDGPEPSDWRFHCPVPANSWWDDIVFT